MLLRRILTVLAILSAASLPWTAGAQQADVIRGRVSGPDSAIANANVTVMSIAGNVSRTARTDASGRFTITFPGGDGDYMVSFTALGFAPKRFELRRTADEDILIADARLTRVGAVLEAVTVTAERERVRRNEILPDVSGTEQTLNNAAVPADLMGISPRWQLHCRACNWCPARTAPPTAFRCSASASTRTTRRSTECSSAGRTCRGMRRSAAR